jgi:long-chain fatty acid transport protein
LVTILLSLPVVVNAQGIVMPGVGPINRSMAGAAVAAPIDAAGAIHWNPAAMSGLESSEFVIGADLLYLSNRLSSSVTVAPGVTLSGSTRSDTGVNVLPTVAVAFRPDDSRWSYGLGLFAVGGFGINYPGDLTNPVLSVPPLGAGPIYSRLSVLQLVPSAAFQVTDRLSIGFAPTLSLADVALDPAALASPDLDGYPAATHGRTFWGGGFQAGIYYETGCDWRLGASYKSPQWFEEATFYTTDAAGLPRELSLDIEYPAIISVGAAYYGLPRWVWATDLRYVDYARAEPFGGNAGYDVTGAVTGLGWRSVFSVATGLQYQATDALSLRFGYLYTQNPVHDEDTFFNVASSAIYEHMIAVGATLRITCRTSFSLSYLHAFETSIAGPYRPAQTLGSPVPGTSVATRQIIDALVAGLEVKF